MQTVPMDRGEGSIQSMSSPHRTDGGAPTTRRANQQTLLRMSSAPTSICPDSRREATEAPGACRKPSGIAERNRGRILFQGWTWARLQDMFGNQLGGMGPFPPDCSQNAVVSRACSLYLVVKWMQARRTM